MKSPAPHPDKDSDETEEEKSTDSVLRGPQRPTKLPASFSAPGAAAAADSPGDQGTNEMTDSGGLRAALQEDDSPEMAMPPNFNVTLLDWINVQDRPNDVESVVRKCFDSINRVRCSWVTHVPAGVKQAGFILGLGYVSILYR